MRNSIITATLLLIAITGFAQQLPFSSQYYTNQFVTNPAFTGNKESTNAFLTHRSQWTGMAGAPQTSYLTIDGPIEVKNIGLGLNLYSDVTDIISRVGVSGNYSYKLSINDDNKILFGLALGVINNKIDFSKTLVRDTDDPFLFTQTQSKTVFNADFGLGYTWKKLEVGFTIPQLLGNKIKYRSNDDAYGYYRLERHYIGAVKYVFDVIKDKEITAYPLIMVRGASGSPFQYDVNAVIDWKKIGWFGITYHSNNAIALSVGVRYKNLSIGYAYDLGIGKIKSFTGSSSEFLLGFTFGTTKKEILPEMANTPEPKDTLTEALLSKLKTKSEYNEAEIDKLKSELEKFKKENEVVKSSSSGNVTGNSTQVAPSADFIDENGTTVGAGHFYVIIGTFSNRENAGKFKDANILKGYSKTQIIQNNKTNVYYVAVLKAVTLEEAVIEQAKVSSEYPDVWIQKLE